MKPTKRQINALLDERNWPQLGHLLGVGMLDPNWTTPGVVSPVRLLSIAIELEGEEFAIQLIRAGAKFEYIEEGWSPLMEACKFELRGVIDALINVGANVNLPSPKRDEYGNCGYTALILSAKKCDLWAVRHLLQAGADPNAATGLNESALFWAGFGPSLKKCGNLELVKDLVKAGTKWRGNELHIPVYKRDVQMVEVFVASGCDVNGRLEPFNKRFKTEFTKDDTPLIVAVRQTTREIFGIEASPNFDQKTQKMVRPAEEETLASLRQRRSEIIKFLLSKGANPNVVNAGGYSPLSYAVMQGENKIAKLLLAANVDPNFGGAGARGKALTPSIMAKKRGLKKFIEMFG